MTQTPIQQAIAFWKQRYDEAKEERAFKMREAAGLFIDYLEAMLSSEKEFVGKVWDAAISYEGFDENENPSGPPNKKQFIDKYYKPE